MPEVIVTPGAQAQFDRLPVPIRVRVQTVLLRLVDWPSVSGAKPLRHELKGAFRVRTGDYRVLFIPDAKADTVTVFRIDDRRDVYK